MTSIKNFLFIAIVALIFSSQPTNAQDELKIMPMGNSLTYGWFPPGSASAGEYVGYRKELYELLDANGYNFDFVGHANNGENHMPDGDHCGIPAIRDNGLASFLTEAYLHTYDPDVILLHIGTNDVAGSIYDDNFTTGIGAILNTIDEYENHPEGKEVLVFVAKIINKYHASGECDPDDYWKVNFFNNEKIAPGVNDRIDNDGDKLVLVDMQCGANINYNSDMVDDVHPTPAGYDKLAQKWFDSMDELHNAPVVSPIPNQDILEGETFTTINLNEHVTDDFTASGDITWTISPASTNFNINISAGRIATITRKSTEWFGSETLNFVATDKGKIIENLKKSASTTVRFSVGDVNQVPVILSQLTTFNENEDTSFDIELSDLEIDDDNDISDLTLNILPGDNYEVSGNTIIPEPDFDEEITINVTVSDLDTVSEEFGVLADLLGENDSPLITDATPPSGLLEDITFEITMDMLEVYEPDNTLEELTISVVPGANYLAVGTTVTPAENYNGLIYVNVRIQDPIEIGNTFSIPTTINEVDDPSVVTSTPITNWDDNVEYNYQITATDIDDVTLTFQAIVIPSWLSLDPSSGLLSGMPTKNDAGTHNIELGVFDGTTSTPHNFDLVINRTNSAPEFTFAPKTEVNIEEVYFEKLEAADDDDDTFRYFCIEKPDFLNFLASRGELFGTPDAEDYGFHDISLGVTDEKDTTILDFSLFVKNLSTLESFAGNELIRIYPNPTESVLNIKIDPSASISYNTIQIIDISGRVMYYNESFDQTFSKHLILELSDLPAGYYTLMLKGNNTSFTERIIISSE